LQAVTRIARRLVAPGLVDEGLDRHHLGRLQRQSGQQSSLPALRQVDGLPVDGHLEGVEE